MAEEKKKKAPLKQRDPLRFYKNGRTACKAGTVVSLATPLVTLFGVKFDEYVKVTSAEDGGTLATFKLTLGGLICVIMAVVITYKYIRHDEKQKKQVTMASFVAGLGVAFALCWCFNAILNDLTEILGYELIGAVSAYGFDLGAQNRQKYIDIYMEQSVRETAKDAYRRSKRDYNGTSV